MTLYNEEYRHSAPFHTNGINNSQTSEKRHSASRLPHAVSWQGLRAAARPYAYGLGVVFSSPTVPPSLPPCLSPTREEAPTRRFVRAVRHVARNPAAARPESRGLPVLKRRLSGSRRDGPVA